MNNPEEFISKPANRAGFALVELLVVLVSIALLTAMSLPVLSKDKKKAQAIQCMSNEKQLGMAWIMYCAENNDALPPAYAGDDSLSGESWMGGTLDFEGDNPHNWDVTVDIMKSLLWPYCGKAASIFKCPADTSQVWVNDTSTQPPVKGYKDRVRSITMNYALNDTDGTMDDISWNPCPPGPWIVYMKTADLKNPGAEMVLLFIDENAASINDGEFCTAMKGYPNQGSQWRLIDIPAAYHNFGAGVSFCDGHAEIHKWNDTRTTKVYPPGTSISMNDSASSNNKDVFWLMDHCTRPK